jgi:Xaa-Pro aminopeptidase
MNKNIKSKVKELRTLMKIKRLDGFIIPHEDEFLTEYTPPSSDRLSWISGFTGSAGLSIINQSSAAIFVDGRYTTQVKMESPSNIFEFRDLAIESQKKWFLERFGWKTKGTSLVGTSFVWITRCIDYG